MSKVSTKNFNNTKNFKCYNTTIISNWIRQYGSMVKQLTSLTHVPKKKRFILGSTLNTQKLKFNRCLKFVSEKIGNLKRLNPVSWVKMSLWATLHISINDLIPVKINPSLTHLSSEITSFNKFQVTYTFSFYSDFLTFMQ